MTSAGDGGAALAGSGVRIESSGEARMRSGPDAVFAAHFAVVGEGDGTVGLALGGLEVVVAPALDVLGVMPLLRSAKESRRRVMSRVVS